MICFGLGAEPGRLQRLNHGKHAAVVAVCLDFTAATPYAASPCVGSHLLKYPCLLAQTITTRAISTMQSAEARLRTNPGAVLELRALPVDYAPSEAKGIAVL